jgi:hypothetical protein
MTTAVIKTTEIAKHGIAAVITKANYQPLINIYIYYYAYPIIKPQMNVPNVIINVPAFS